MQGDRLTVSIALPLRQASESIAQMSSPPYLRTRKNGTLSNDYGLMMHTQGPRRMASSVRLSTTRVFLQSHSSQQLLRSTPARMSVVAASLNFVTLTQHEALQSSARRLVVPGDTLRSPAISLPRLSFLLLVGSSSWICKIDSHHLHLRLLLRKQFGFRH